MLLYSGLSFKLRCIQIVHKEFILELFKSIIGKSLLAHVVKCVGNRQVQIDQAVNIDRQTNAPVNR